MGHRSAIDIIGGILDAANERKGVGRARIMFKAFLSHSQLKEYLPALTESDLLRYDVDTQTFKTTQKGLRFLNTYNQIYDAIKISPQPQPEPEPQPQPQPQPQQVTIQASEGI
jgi:predicted transcriptional regulator